MSVPMTLSDSCCGFTYKNNISTRSSADAENPHDRMFYANLVSPASYRFRDKREFKLKMHLI